MNDASSTSPGSQFNSYWRLMRFDRPIGILLLLWPTLWALWVAAQGVPSIKNLFIFCAGVVVMRAAGCVANDLADRDFDGHVERTRGRPLANGELRPRQAAGLLLALLTLALLLVLMTNRQTVLLSLAGAALAVSYPLFKRFTHYPQIVLGVAFGWGIPMAFTAETGSIAPVAWWLLLANVVFSVIYDTQYAMVDRDDDLAIGIKSTAIAFGRHDLKILMVLQLFMLAILIGIGLTLGFHWPWWLALSTAGALFFWQQRLIRDRGREACFRAFLNNNWVGLALFFGLALEYGLRAGGFL